MAKSSSVTVDVNTPPAAPSAVSTPPKLAAIHDAPHQTRLLREALQSDKVRIGYFLGAGCPLGIYDEKDEKSLGHIPDVAGLTKKVCELLAADDKADSLQLLPRWTAIETACKGDSLKEPNVEHLLTEIRTVCARRGASMVDGLSKSDLQDLDTTVCDHIAKIVGVRLPSHRCSYNRFASWVGGLQRIAPIELFTPNYDLLLEEALEQHQIPHFDGFVGAREPFFDIASIEQDAIPSRWTRLWKLHGSVNWQKRDGGGVFRVAGIADKGKAMIYPSHLKYDQSRRMPYLAMLDRLKAFFRSGGHSEGHGPPVLVVCGYSFCDEHLNELILDGLRGNRAAQCFVLAYSSLADSRSVVELAVRQPNLSVIAWDGAVIGTREGSYKNIGKQSASDDRWITTTTVTPKGGGDAIDQVHCRLGDFHYFCLFLEHLCGGLINEGTPNHG